MCGRYFVDDGIERELKNAFQAVNISKIQAKAGDVHPTELAFILTGDLSDTDEMGISEKGPKGSAHQCESGDGEGKAHV